MIARAKTTCIWIVFGILTVLATEALDNVSADHNVILPEFTHQVGAQLRPPCPVHILRHDLDNGDVVMLGRFTGLPAALRRRAGKARHASEALGEALRQALITLCGKRLPHLIAKRQQDFDQVHHDLCFTNFWIAAFSGTSLSQ